MKNAFRLGGLAAFLGSLALLGWWWIVIAGRGTGTVRASAAVVDVVLFGVFALHHSVMARPVPQRVLARVVAPDLMRTVYVWIASVLLASMCLAWQQAGGTVYAASGPIAQLLRVLQVAGVAVAAAAVRRIRVSELAGCAPPDPRDELQRGGPYGVVRHPLYLGWVLIVWSAPHMTGDRLLFAILSTLYLVVAVPFEEAGLMRQFGERYREYRESVRWRIVPYVY